MQLDIDGLLLIESIPCSITVIIYVKVLKLWFKTCINAF